MKVSVKVLRFQPRNVHIYVASECNLACTYCWNRGGTFGKRYHGMMDEQTAESCIRFVRHIVESQHPQAMSFSLFGGEPLLNRKILVFLVQELLRIRLTKQVDMRILLFSNGCFIDKELVGFIRGCRHVEYHVGLDGAADVHDRCRVDHAGHGSYSKVSDTVKALLEEGVFVVAESVVLPPYDYAALIHTYEMLGIRYAYIQDDIIPMHGDAPCARVILPREVGQWAIAYRNLTQLYFVLLTQRRAPLIDPLFGTVKQFLSRTNVPGIACTAGTSQIAISAQGGLYACNQLLDVEDFGLGDVFSGLDETRYRRVLDHFETEGATVTRNRACQKCEIRDACRGGCYARNLLATGDIGRIEGRALCTVRRLRAGIDWRFVQQMVATFPTYVEDVKGRDYLKYFPDLFSQMPA